MVSSSSAASAPYIYGIDDRTESGIARLNSRYIDSRTIGYKDKMRFFELLGGMVDAGVSLPSALTVIARRSESQRLSRICDTMAYYISQGRRLSASMAMFPDVFSESEVAIIEVGETSANLDDMLRRLSEAAEKNFTVLQKVNSALLYPGIVVLTMLVSGWLIFTFVVPQLSRLFIAADAEIPLYSRVFFGLGNFLQDYFWHVAIAMVALVWAVWAYSRTEGGRRYFDGLLLSLPVIGDVAKKSNMIRFARSISYLLSGGVGVVRTLELAERSVASPLYQEAIHTITGRVANGEKLSDAIADQGDLFTEDFATIIAVGEKTANIAGNSEKSAAFLERELDISIKNLTTLIEPALLVIVGLFVAWFVFAVFGSIFTLTGVVGGL